MPKIVGYSKLSLFADDTTCKRKSLGHNHRRFTISNIPVHIMQSMKDLGVSAVRDLFWNSRIIH